MPQMSPLYWPAIFIMLSYFMMSCKSSMAWADTKKPSMAPIGLLTTTKNLKW